MILPGLQSVLSLNEDNTPCSFPDSSLTKFQAFLVTAGEAGLSNVCRVSLMHLSSIWLNVARKLFWADWMFLDDAQRVALRAVTVGSVSTDFGRGRGLEGRSSEPTLLAINTNAV